MARRSEVQVLSNTLGIRQIISYLGSSGSTRGTGTNKHTSMLARRGARQQAQRDARYARRDARLEALRDARVARRDARLSRCLMVYALC